MISTYNAHDKQCLLQLYHPDFEGDEFKRSLLEWGAVGDKYFFFWKASGHQRGRLVNIPPTGKFCSFLVAPYLRVRDGKIIRTRGRRDVTALRNIGLLPEPTSTDYG